MTELGFLLDLLLNEELPLTLKKTVAERIKEVEQKLMQPTVIIPTSRPITQAQAPSTQRILDEMDQQAPGILVASQAASQAMASRQEAISKATQIEPGRKSPRKF